MMELKTSAGSVGCIKIDSATLFGKYHLKSVAEEEKLVPFMIEVAMLLKCLPNLLAIWILNK